MYPARRNQAWIPSVFGDLFDDFAVMPAKQFASPAVNIKETEKAFEIEIAAPGMTRDDFKISINSDNELVINLEKKAKEGKLYYLGSDAYEYCVQNVRAIEKTDDMIQYEKINSFCRSRIRFNRISCFMRSQSRHHRP